MRILYFAVKTQNDPMTDWPIISILINLDELAHDSILHCILDTIQQVSLENEQN